MPTPIAADPAADQAKMLQQMRDDNNASFERQMEMNHINKEGDAQKELAAGIGNSQKSAHDALMQLIGNLK